MAGFADILVLLLLLTGFADILWVVDGVQFCCIVMGLDFAIYAIWVVDRYICMLSGWLMGLDFAVYAINRFD